MKDLIKYYVNNELVPFSLTIGWNTNKNKKELLPHIGWKDTNINNYKKYITKDIIKSKKEEVINLNNCLALRMGTATKDNYYIIGVDIDNKPDDKEKEIYNGVEKFYRTYSNLTNLTDEYLSNN